MRLARAGAVVLAVTGVAGLALLAAGCAGGSSNRGVAKLGTTSTSSSSAGGTSKANPAKYSVCMRRNGVSNFPDPDASGHFRMGGLVPKSLQFKKAQQACK